jgi:signal transduction histidine kinase
MRRGARAGRSTLVTPLLLVSVATMALLTASAHVGSVYHRATAERVLRDFAALAAGELVRRSTAQIGYDGYGVLLGAVSRHVGPEGLPPALPELLAGDDVRVARAAALGRRFFVASAAHVVFVPAPPGAEQEAWIRGQLAAGGPEAARGFRVVHGVVAGEPLRLVLAPTPSPGWRLVGFQLEPAQLREWFAEALGGGTLLPPSLGNGRVTNAALSIRVSDEAGIERFRAGGGPWPLLGAEVPFGTAYSGVLDGLTVALSIDPDAAHELLIGGLPRSRLPMLLGLLALGTTLVLAAIRELRRERGLQRLRAEFVASVSHELRTPLTQIRMFAETLLLDRVRFPDERRRSLEIVDREARRLTHLVDNVLQFSRGERGALSVSPEPRLLAPIVREVVEQSRPLVGAAGTRVDASLDEAALAAVDADALRQVLLNLLDNAVKYGPRGQRVRIELTRADGLVRLAVDDEGPGIPAAERQRVFERFHRLERDRRSALAGTGIGLAVVRDLVERHGGRCHVEASARGGARFVVELTASDAPSTFGSPRQATSQEGPPRA